MDKRFLTAFLQPEKTKIAGYELDPFCFRHLITLEAIGSPYINMELNNEIMPKPEDVIIFLKICSGKNWEESLSKKTWKDRYTYYSMRYDIEKFVKINSEIITYFRDSCSLPRLWVKAEETSSNSKKSDSFHQSIMTVTVLMSKFGFSEKDAWNLPISRGSWYITAFSKLEGGEVDVIRTSDEENAKEDLARIKKIEEEALRQFSKVIKNKKIKV